MRAIILAAGPGQRMLPLTKDMPKALLPIGNQTLLSRLLTQLTARGVSDIAVVTGFQKARVRQAIEELGNPAINIIENDRYQEDTNILSLTMALDGRITPFTVLEADIILDDDVVKKAIDLSDGDRSYWYTIGPFQSHQGGGILKPGPGGTVADVQVVDRYEDKYAGYRKLIGLLTVGRNEMEYYTRVLFDECRKSTKQYYLNPWIKNLSRLKCYECNLEGQKAVAVNRPEEYREALKLFGDETG